MGLVAHLPGGDPSMMARASEGPDSEKHHRVHQASTSFLSATKVKYLTLGSKNDYMPPPIPHCIEWDAYLPLAMGNFASQDY